MTRSRQDRRIELLFVLLLTVLALAIRIYQLDQIPPGLNADEAANGVDVLDVLDGQRPIFFERNGGREPLFIYLQALAVALLGATPWALRLTSAIAGALTVPAIYWMVREAFVWRADARWLAAWTAVGVAFSYWHLIFSRIGFRAIMLPLMASITFALFWRAYWKLQAGERFPTALLIMCGLCLGLSLYTYISARFLPILLIFVSGVGILQSRHSPRIFRSKVAATLLIFVTAFLVFLPLGSYFLTNSQDFTSRSAETLLWMQPEARANPAASLADNVVRTAGMFGFLSDPNLRHNPAQHPAFDSLLAAWLIAGVLLAVSRLRIFSYLFVLSWLAILAIPALITAEAPHYLRMLAVIPAAYFLVVLPMVDAGAWLARYRPRLAPWVPLPFLIISGALGIQSYFDGSIRNIAALEDPSDARFVDAIPLMSRYNSPPGAWIIPFWPVYDVPNQIPIIDFLTQRQVTASLVDAREEAAPEALRRATARSKRAYLLGWHNAAMLSDDGYALIDAQSLVRFLLQKYGHPVREVGENFVSITAFDLPDASDFRIAHDEQPASISFGGQIELVGFAYGHTAVQGQEETSQELEEKWAFAGHPLWAVLRWQAQAPLEKDLKVSLLLTGEDGHLAGQVDDLLMDESVFRAMPWKAGQKASSYHIIPSLPAIPPGRYRLHVAVYDPETMVRLPALSAEGAAGVSTAYLGDLDILRSGVAFPVTLQNTLAESAQAHRGLQLLGYDLSASTLRQGDRLSLTLYWRAASAPPHNEAIRVELRDAQGVMIALDESDPATSHTALAELPDGAVQRDWHEVRIPPDAPPGEYGVYVTLNDGATQLGEVSLGSIGIEGRPRSYIEPEIQHPETLTLGDSIALVGYELDPSDAAVGAPIDITLFWKALQPMEKSYTVFLHLLDADGRVVAQRDSPPGDGELPTRGWTPGEYITDSYQLLLPADIPPGEYRLELGMYDAESVRRLLISGPNGEPVGDHLLLDVPVRIGGL